jgi:DNA-directed RNA polymerase subunit RPC12/RpoP
MVAHAEKVSADAENGNRRPISIRRDPMGSWVVSLMIGDMNITFQCAKCHADARLKLPSDVTEFTCPQCHTKLRVPAGAFEGSALTRCLVCPSTELFIRKDFPQRLGVGIVVAGFALSSIAWAYMLPIWSFGILFVTAFIDLLLYILVPDALMCYRCGAQYRSVEGMERHGPFDLETHERYRQQQARQKQMQQQGRQSIAANAAAAATAPLAEATERTSI